MNETKSAPVYCGNGKEHKFEDGGSVIHFSLKLSKIKEHIYDFNVEKYVNLTMCANKDGANEYGKTHYVKINDFKPEAKKTAEGSSDTEALPF